MFDSFAIRYQKFAPFFLRIGLAFVFALFGIQKLLNPGQTTAEVQLITNFDLVDAAALNFYLGLLEISIALSFLFGFKVRLFAFTSFLMVSLFFFSFLSKYGVSLNPDLYRDIGLAGASIALFLMGAGPLSIDNRSSSKERSEGNKYLALVLFGVSLLLSGFIYQTYYKPASITRIQSTGEKVVINMRVLKNQWKWEPSILKVNPGDKLVLNIYNEDTYDHGFAVDVFGVNRRLFPQTTTVVEFTPSLMGKFNFYCSVPCGEGHYDQIGTLIVGDSQAQSQSLRTVAFNSFSFTDRYQCQNQISKIKN